MECSAMSWKRLITDFAGRLHCEPTQANTFDIHGGGIDLVFPHHENEIAQSCCALGTARMANVWMHNGFLQVEGEKMSKSLGNFVTIRELLNTTNFGGRSWSGEVLRLAMLRTHYRQPIDWTVTSLIEARKSLATWARVWMSNLGEAEIASEAAELLNDDLNTPALLAWIHRTYNEAERGNHAASRQLTSTLQALGFTDLFVKSKGTFGLTDAEKNHIDDLVGARTAARAAKNWAESDQIRDQLAAMGIALKDNKDGTTTWEPTTTGEIAQ
jgi:cysteinyl-tRNA synthetase